MTTVNIHGRYYKILHNSNTKLRKLNSIKTKIYIITKNLTAITKRLDNF